MKLTSGMGVKKILKDSNYGDLVLPDSQGDKVRCVSRIMGKLTSNR